MTHPRLLLVSHDALRTGAPRVAIEVLAGLEGAPVERIAMLKRGGPLASEFRRRADEVVIQPRSVLRGLLRRARLYRGEYRPSPAGPALERRMAARAIRRLRPDLVYANTVVSGDFAREAARRRLPAILHCHELEPYASHFVKRYDLAAAGDAITWVACSQAVRDHLSHLLNRPADRIEVVPEPVDVGAIRSRAREVPPFPLPAGPIVAACGTVDHRKGPDLWLEAARMVLSRARNPDVTFIWAGTGPDLEKLRAEVGRLGLQGRVRFVGECENPHPIIGAATVFTVPSRVDPFPLVALEAMALARPVVGFASGGLPEQLGKAGDVCAPGDTASMAAAVVRLLEDRDAAARLGRDAARRAEALFDVSKFRQRIRTIVTAVLERRGPERGSQPVEAART